MKTKQQTINTLSRLTDEQLKAFECMVFKKAVTYDNSIYIIVSIDENFKLILENIEGEVIYTSVSSVSFD